MLKLYNTLTRKKQSFKPRKGKTVNFYACGPTVYWYAHIGNFRTYCAQDILRRTLEYFGYSVKHVMNITDVGHLTSDADTGDDKIEMEARKEKKTAWHVAAFYTSAFKSDSKKLNILTPKTFCKATNYIKEQIALIKNLEKLGYTYETNDGIYFNTKKITRYGELGKLNIAGLKSGARVKMNKEKKNITDFALWKFSPKDKRRQMEWNSPWGVGFPGWHTECVAMSIKHLGNYFDIHAGGIDHVPIHHTNEIAQARALTGMPLARFWMHPEFLLIDKGRMGKSEGNAFTIHDLQKHGIAPLAFRYLTLNTHYRTKLNFTWKGLEAAQNALNSLYKSLKNLEGAISSPSTKTNVYIKQFNAALKNDLNTPKALAILWRLIRDKNISVPAKRKTIVQFDAILGLNLAAQKAVSIPQNIKYLAHKREHLRSNKQFIKADNLRKKIEGLGYRVEDGPTGPTILKI